MAEQLNDDQHEDVAPADKSSVWDKQPLKTLRAAFKTAAALTSPVWWPAKKAGQVAIWGLKRESVAMKVITPVFAAAALGTYLGAATYGAALAYVKTNDMTSFLNWPATEGHWEGKITRFSEIGTWPCNSYEGNLRTGEASDFEHFVVRKWDTAMLTALQSIPPNTQVTLVYRVSGIDQETFETNSLVRCIQRGDHTAVGVHYGSVSVGIKPN